MSYTKPENMPDYRRKGNYFMCMTNNIGILTEWMVAIDDRNDYGFTSIKHFWKVKDCIDFFENETPLKECSTKNFDNDVNVEDLVLKYDKDVHDIKDEELPGKKCAFICSDENSFKVFNVENKKIGNLMGLFESRYYAKLFVIRCLNI
jgi:hypothetical protein